MSEAQVLEGTWEEIGPKAQEIGRRYGRRRLKLILLSEDPEPAAKPELPKPTLSPEESIRVLDELAESNRNLPVLPPEAFSRESIYEDVV
jgi:hypothetical protein